LDRASTFNDTEIVSLLSDRYIPVAIDVWYHERRKDDEGALYRRIIGQRKGLRPGRTTQGFYIAGPDGKLLNGWNNRNADRLRKRLGMELARYQAPEGVSAKNSRSDTRFERRVPDGGVVIDVSTRILEADWGEGEVSRWQRIHRGATGHDHLWTTKAEISALREGRLPTTLLRRIARYHLIDNTRGEPPMWSAAQIRQSSWTGAKVDDGKFKNGLRITGAINLATDDGKRGYEARALGFVAFDGDRIKQFDMVVRGLFHGHGRWTGGAPKKPFTLAVAFSLADPKRAASRVPPQGARDLKKYLETY